MTNLLFPHQHLLHQRFLQTDLGQLYLSIPFDALASTLPAPKHTIRYASHSLCINKDIPFPVPSNQKMNDYLKEIAGVCGIDKILTFHIARHIFATTITLSNGVPIESVSKMLGHSSLKQNQHYAKILDVKVSADMLLLKQKL